jgi:hypothetical protein
MAKAEKVKKAKKVEQVEQVEPVEEAAPVVTPDFVKISKVVGRQILDSRGNPTVEVDITLDNGIMARAAVPVGRIDRRIRSLRTARWRQEGLPWQGCAESRRRGQRQRSQNCSRARTRLTSAHSTRR